MSEYRIIKRIGKGGSGIIYLAWHSGLKKNVVLKEMIAGKTSPEMMRYEVDILKKVHHTYLPQVYDFLISDGRYYMVEDYIDGESLEEIIKRGIWLDEQQIIKWMKQLSQVLDYLHTRPQKIIHSDIKPANIMITREGNVCLIDFNISVMAGDKGQVVKGYSQRYASPEQLYLSKIITQYGHSNGLSLTPASDIYSLCATFYTVLTHSFPPPNKDFLLAGQEKVPYSYELKSVLDRGMVQNPERRIKSARELEKILNHLEKLAPAYQSYIFRRTLASILGMLLLAAGIVMICYGNNLNIKTRYITERNSVEQIYREEGASSAAAQKAEAILENDTYEYLLKNRQEERAQLYSILGEYYYLMDSDAGYENALYYNGMACRYGRNGSKALFYDVNYAASLYRVGRYEESLQILGALRSDQAGERCEIAYYEALNYHALQDDEKALVSVYEAMDLYAATESEKRIIDENDLKNLKDQITKGGK